MKWPLADFSQLATDVSGGNVKTLQSDFLPSGKYPVIDQGQAFIAGYSDDASRLCRTPGPVIVFGDHTKCFKFVDFPFCMGADGTKVLMPKDGVNAKYLYYALQTVHIPEAGYSRHFKYLRAGKLPLPPLPEQRRIAAILDQADALRRLRRQSRSQLVDLKRALFYEIFGDPALNLRGFSMRPLRELAIKFSDGPFGSNLKSSHYVENGVRVVRLQNIGVDEFVGDDAAYISESHFGQLCKHECLPGDVLVGTLGDPNLRACLQPQWLTRALNKADCVQIRVDPRVATGEYVCALLNIPSVENMARSLVLGQTRARISMGRLRDLKVPVAPKDLQDRFTAVIAQLKVETEVAEKAVAVSDSLVASLQHRAFRGEL